VSKFFKLFARWSGENLNPKQRERDWRRLMKIENAVKMSIQENGGIDVVQLMNDNSKLGERMEKIETRLEQALEDFRIENSITFNLENKLKDSDRRNRELLNQLDALKLERSSEGW
jgi:hypothetical protein